MAQTNSDLTITLVAAFLLLAGLITGIIVVYLLYQKQQLYALELEKKESQLEYERTLAKHQKEQLEKDIAIVKSQQELELYKLKLNAFKDNIISKSKLITELQDQPNFHQNSDIIYQLKSKNILTDDDWKTFIELFERVFEGYSHRLKETVANITPAETKVVVLSKLKFSNQEMADTLGVSTQAIRTTWHRLKKKLSIAEDTSLVNFAETI